MIKTYKSLISHIYMWGNENIKLYKAPKKNYYFISFNNTCFEISKRIAKFVNKELFIGVGEWGK